MVGVAVCAQIVGQVSVEIQRAKQDQKPVADDQCQQQREQKLVWQDGGLEEFEHVGKIGRKVMCDISN